MAGVRYRALSLIFVIGCGTDVPDPLPDAVTPDHGYNGVETQVTIAGRYFYPQVGIDAATGDPDPNNAFKAWLELEGASTQLANVSLVDFATLTAFVPDGLERGSYDLRVEGPTGADGVLPAATGVSFTRGVRIDFEGRGARICHPIRRNAGYTSEESNGAKRA